MQPSDPQSQQPASGNNPQPDPQLTNALVRPRRPLWQKILFIAIIVLLVAVAVVGAYSSKHKKSGSSGTSSDTSLYYDRPGYDRQVIGTDIGDPLAIKLSAKDGAQTLSNGTAVIQACSVLTAQNLADQGLHLYSNAYGFPVMQNYLDNSGEATFSPNTINFPLSSDTVSCHYGIDVGKKDSTDSVAITVNQPFAVTESEIDREVSSYAPQPDMSGYKVYKSDKSYLDVIRYLFRKGGTAIVLELSLSDKSKEDALVKQAVSNLVSMESKPKGITTVSYDTPTFKQPIVKACDLADNADMKQLSGNDASPLLHEMWPTATGVADFSSVSSYKTKTNYLRSQCERMANLPEYKTLVGIGAHKLQVTATSFENDQAAMQGLLYLTVGEGNDTKKNAPTSIGQESYIFKDPKDHQNALAFRRGRVVIQLLYDYAQQDSDPQVSNLDSYGQKLTPVAQKIDQKIKGFK